MDRAWRSAWCWARTTLVAVAAARAAVVAWVVVEARPVVVLVTRARAPRRAGARAGAWAGAWARARAGAGARAWARAGARVGARPPRAPTTSARDRETGSFRS